MAENNTGGYEEFPDNEIFADAQDIDCRIDEMAATVIERYKDKDPLFVCLMRGGAPFASKLMFSLTRQDPSFHPEMDFMTIATYGQELVGKQPRIVMDLAPTTKTQGRPVIILDDVLDKGYTARFTKAHLELRGASSVDLIVLVQKDTERTQYGDATLYGFEAPDEWLVGMGMDDPRVRRDAHRWAGHLAIAAKNETDQ